MFDLQTIIGMNSKKHGNKPFTQRVGLSAKDCDIKSKAKALYYSTKAKAIAGGVVAALIAFTMGSYTGHNQYVSAQGMPSTDADLIELLREENARLSARAERLAFALENNPRVIPFEYDDCEAMFMDFYSEYPMYHYETEDKSIVIDYVVPNPQEEAAQYCTFIIDSFARTHKLQN